MGSKKRSARRRQARPGGQLPAEVRTAAAVVDAGVAMAVAMAFSDLAKALTARCDRLASEFGPEHPATLALAESGAAFAEAGVAASGRLVASVRAAGLRVGPESHPGPDRGSASVAAPSGGGAV